MFLFQFCVGLHPACKFHQPLVPLGPRLSCIPKTRLLGQTPIKVNTTVAFGVARQALHLGGSKMSVTDSVQVFEMTGVYKLFLHASVRRNNIHGQTLQRLSTINVPQAVTRLGKCQ